PGSSLWKAQGAASQWTEISVVDSQTPCAVARPEEDGHPGDQRHAQDCNPGSMVPSADSGDHPMVMHTAATRRVMRLLDPQNRAAQKKRDMQRALKDRELMKMKAFREYRPTWDWQGLAGSA